MTRGQEEVVQRDPSRRVRLLSWGLGVCVLAAVVSLYLALRATDRAKMAETKADEALRTAHLALKSHRNLEWIIDEAKAAPPRGSTAHTITLKAKQIIVEQLGVDSSQVELSSTFVGDLMVDSVDNVELIMAFEEAFDIDIPDEVCEKLNTVGQAIKMIEKLVSEKVPPRTGQ